MIEALVTALRFERPDAWFAAILARNRLGIAMAAMINMMATTIRSSIREKPRLRSRTALEFWIVAHIFISR